MAMGRINSDRSINLASRVVHAFGGDWSRVKAASTRDSDGVRVIRLEDLEFQEKMRNRLRDPG